LAISSEAAFFSASVIVFQLAGIFVKIGLDGYLA
jgi:hypothetical protein